MELNEYLEMCKDNINIVDAFVKADSVINNPKYKSIVCSISGGSDSDVMLDLLYKVDKDSKIMYVFFDTGLEYKATKDHLKYLENKYNIHIHKERAVKPIPLAVKEYGQPFISKDVSYKMYMLQNNNFDWKDYTFEEFCKKFPKVKSAGKWWCNTGESDRFNIEHNKFLKEFLIQNPPKFKISEQCCHYAKKKVAENYYKQHNVDLYITGVRKSEGGSRATVYKNCYTIKDDGIDSYRPLFWVSSYDKQYYESKFNIRHSKCYTKYVFTRTGCAGCPFSGNHLAHELEQTKIYEPLLYKAITNTFNESYEYTRQYREFVKYMREQEIRKTQKLLF